MKITIKEKERIIIIDNYFYIGGVVVPNTICHECEGIVIYYDKYDNDFCPYCNQWIKPRCGDDHCCYCADRPEPPLNVKTLADVYDKNID